MSLSNRSFLFVFLLCYSLSAWSEPVVVYTSVDEVLSAEIFDWIEERTDLDILPVYDTEATKVTGLYMRILEERGKPRADVFWNGEFSRTLLLEKEGLLAPYQSAVTDTIPAKFKDSEGHWYGMAARARVLAYNTNLVAKEEVPRTLEALADPKWKGRVVWANPMFGTTGTHCGAFLALWGEAKFSTVMKSWVEQFRSVASNGQTAKLVADGAVPLGMTDTDDVFRLMLEGKPIDSVPIDADGEGTLLIPATVALIAGAPHPDAGKKLIDALLDPEVERRIAFSSSRQIPVRADIEVPDDLQDWRNIRSLPLSFEEVAGKVDQALMLVRPMLLER